MTTAIRTDGRSWIRQVTARDPVIAPLLPRLAELAVGDAPVLIAGEPGTGRELVARAIHNLSQRAPGPFVVVDCVDPSGELLEAELLGVDTGERPRKLGAFEQATDGTLFLAEVGELSATAQEDLLRLIQRRETMRLYATKPVTADVRCLASTTADLRPRVAAGLFRPDLHALLSDRVVRLAPLRERLDELPALTGALLAAARRIGGPSGCAPEALAALRAYSWPGNLHELRETIEDAALHASGAAIQVADLPARIRDAAGPGRSLHSLERAEIRRAMEQAGGKQREAARRLGISRWALGRRLRKYGLDVSRTSRAG